MDNSRLERLLNELVEKYGVNQGYPVPTISWSEENMMSRYGEYQFWKNHIYVSRVLNSDKIADKDLQYIIFHELNHQISVEHGKLFQKRMKEFNIDSEVEMRLNNYLDDCVLQPAKHQPIQFEKNKRTVVCQLNSTKKDVEKYINLTFYFDHYVLGVTHVNAEKIFCDKLIPQVIWVIKAENKYWIIGWAKDVHLYSMHEYVDYTDLDMGTLDFNFMYKRDNGVMVFPINALEIGTLEVFPKDFGKLGICGLDDLSKELSDYMFDSINSFEWDYVDCGIAENVLDLQIPFDCSVEKLINLYQEQTSWMRKIWILNKICKLTPSYKWYVERAKAYAQGDVYDLAIDDLARALHYPMENLEKKEFDEITKLFSVYAIMHQFFIDVRDEFEID